MRRSQAVLRALLTAWFAVTLDFFIPRLLPGDPAVMLLGRLRGDVKPEALAAVREAFGLAEGPWWAQYASWLGHVVRGDLGVSISRFPEPVVGVIGRALPWTLLLSVGATLLSFALGSALGIAAARRPGGWLDRFVTPVLVFIGAFPYFWLAMMALWVVSWQANLLPSRHAWDDGLAPGMSVAFWASVLRHAILPMSTLVVAGAGGWMVGMRNVVEALQSEPWAVFARARGLSEGHILRRYVLRLALVPQVSALGLSLGYAVSGALLTEMVFAYPGTGWLLLEAVRGQDWPLLQGLFLVLALTVTALTALVDGVVGWLDPRAQEAP